MMGREAYDGIFFHDGVVTQGSVRAFLGDFGVLMDVYEILMASRGAISN